MADAAVCRICFADLVSRISTFWLRAVLKLCQNPICLAYRELLFEREQLPQAVDNKHFRIELIEHLEPVMVLRNQQVAGSTVVLIVHMASPSSPLVRSRPGALTPLQRKDTAQAPLAVYDPSCCSSSRGSALARRSQNQPVSREHPGYRKVGVRVRSLTRDPVVFIRESETPDFALSDLLTGRGSARKGR
jgi:hypothetical protein